MLPKVPSDILFFPNGISPSNSPTSPLLSLSLIYSAPNTPPFLLTHAATIPTHTQQLQLVLTRACLVCCEGGGNGDRRERPGGGAAAAPRRRGRLLAPAPHRALRRAIAFRVRTNPPFQASGFLVGKALAWSLLGLGICEYEKLIEFPVNRFSWLST